MNRVTERIIETLDGVTHQEVSSAIHWMLQRGFLENPATPACQSYLLDEVNLQLRGLGSGQETLIEILRNRTDAWTDEQIKYVGTGYDFALMVLYRVLEQSATL
jgi:hypothetical protein